MYLYHNANKARCWEPGFEKKEKQKLSMRSLSQSVASTHLIKDYAI